MKPTAALTIQRSIRVLVVDDEPLFLELIDALLEVEYGLQVVGKASHGQEAVKLAHELDPDVIIMDISMPVMDGLEATRLIRRNGTGARVLILTGSTTDRDQARMAGAAGYLTKDRIASELVSEIRNLGSK